MYGIPNLKTCNVRIRKQGNQRRPLKIDAYHEVTRVCPIRKSLKDKAQYSQRDVPGEKNAPRKAVIRVIQNNKNAMSVKGVYHKNKKQVIYNRKCITVSEPIPNLFSISSYKYIKKYFMVSIYYDMYLNSVVKKKQNCGSSSMLLLYNFH